MRLVANFLALILITFFGRLEVQASQVFFDGRIAVFDTGKANSHEAKVLSVLKPALSNCRKCGIKTYPIYSKTGELVSEHFVKQLKKAQTAGIKLFHLSWNLPSDEKTRDVEQAMQEFLDAGGVIVAAAGANPTGVQKQLKLSDTVMAKIKRIFLIGELDNTGALAMNSNYGPEIFTALKPSGQLKGSSFSAPLFTARLATWWKKNDSLTGQEVVSLLTKKKADRFLPSMNLLFE